MTILNSAKLFIFSIIIFHRSIMSVSEYPIILFIAFDAFRWDYIERGLTPTLEQLRNSGSTTKYMYNVFPTVTSPNFFSIATGLYPQTHGVLGNRLFTEQFQCVEDKKLLHELFHYNDRIVPLWNLNEISSTDRHSGTILWPSSQVTYQHNVTYNFQNQSASYTERVDTAIRWIVNKENPANLIFLYFEQPDYDMHMHGPNSPQVNQQLLRVDHITQYLMEKLRENNLQDQVNLIFLSDHGSTDLPLQNIVDLAAYSDKDLYRACGETPIFHIQIKEGHEHEVHQQFLNASKQTKAFDIFKPEEIPDRWHIKKSTRLSDLLIVARHNYGFVDAKLEKGAHGYDFSDDMRPFFFANGPLFKSNFTTEPFNNIDIYPLVMKVLNLVLPDGAVKPDGILTNSSLAKILKNLNNLTQANQTS